MAVDGAGAPGEVALFLRAHAPFDALDPAEVERVAGAAEVEALPAGSTIFRAGEGPVEHLRVIRSGAVELVAGGRLLDLLGTGELFGQASMLSGLPAGFEARAAEDTVCYRFERQLAESILSAPAGLRFVARSLLEPPSELHRLAREPARNLADEPVAGLVRGEPVVCGPETAIRAAAELMSAAGQGCAVITLGQGAIGIVTDRDLRTRVVAAGVPVEAPVSEVMSHPAYSCAPDRPAGDVLLEMLDRGLRHMPVMSARGTVLGVVDDVDLMAARARSSFYLRQRIARARSVSELALVAAELRPMVIALHEGGVSAPGASAMYAIAVDALTRRALELETQALGRPEVELAWLALGSQARREALPASDVDSALVWFSTDEDEDEERVRAGLLELSSAVVAVLRRCGLPADEHGASAADPAFVRSLSSWQALARSLIEDPTRDQALVLVSTLVDSRPVWGVHLGTPVSDSFRLAPRHPGLLRMLARFALAVRPPTGFFRGLVVESSGEHRGRLDLKRGGAIPIQAIARWGAMAAGVTAASTRERLRAAAEGGTLPVADAETLTDAFELIAEVRFEHQVAQLRAGEEPDDFLDPRELSPLMRTQLRDAFRAVASVQKRIAGELDVGVR